MRNLSFKLSAAILITVILTSCGNIQTNTESLSFEAIYGIPEETSITLSSLPKEIEITSENQDIQRSITVTLEEECRTKHTFGFETYSGEFTTKGGLQLARLSYPELGDDKLFTSDEYGYSLANGTCLTLSYVSILSKKILDGQYDEGFYESELKIAAKIMSTITIN